MKNAKLKIVHICTFTAGGAGRAAFRLHKALLNEGIESEFVCIDKSTKEDRVSKLELTNKSYDTNYLDKWMVKIRWRLKRHLKIDLNKTSVRIVNKLHKASPSLKCEIATLPFSDYNVLGHPKVQEADIIHLHWVAGMIDYPSFFKNTKKPIVWTLHDKNPIAGIFHLTEDEVVNRAIAGRLDGKVKNLKRIAIGKLKPKLILVAPSNWLIEEAEKENHLKNTLKYCISNTLDLEQFYPNKISDFKQKNNINEDNFALLFISHSVSSFNKGFDLLLEALKLVEGMPITVLVVGGSEGFDVDKIDLRNLGNINNSDKLSAIYSNVDALIIPSRNDNLPNVMLESLACGTPVIGFPVGGIKEHITDFTTGLLAKEISSEALALSIRKFCENRNRFDKDTIRNYAVTHFDEKMIAEKYIEVYQKLLAE